ncbi:unnamed protein product [Brassica oleracea var. botrytis]
MMKRPFFVLFSLILGFTRCFTGLKMMLLVCKGISISIWPISLIPTRFVWYWKSLKSH